MWETNIAERDLNEWKTATEKTGATIQEILEPGEKYQGDFGERIIQNGSVYLKIKLPAGTAHQQKNNIFEALRKK